MGVAQLILFPLKVIYKALTVDHPFSTALLTVSYYFKENTVNKVKSYTSELVQPFE